MRLTIYSLTDVLDSGIRKLPRNARRKFGLMRNKMFAAVNILTRWISLCDSHL